MKRILVAALAALASIALLGSLVYALLYAADAVEPAVSTVRGFTSRRLWATTAAVLALAGVTLGTWALRSRAGQNVSPAARMRAIAALAAGLIAAINGGLNVAVAQGGPGTGNGVVGGAVALILGLVAMVLGGLAIIRARRDGSPIRR